MYFTPYYLLNYHKTSSSSGFWRFDPQFLKLHFQSVPDCYCECRTARCRASSSGWCFGNNWWKGGEGERGSRGDRGSTRATAGHRASQFVRWKIKAMKSLLSTCMDQPHISLFPLQRALQSNGVCPVCLNCAGGRARAGGDRPVIQKYWRSAPIHQKKWIRVSAMLGPPYDPHFHSTCRTEYVQRPFCFCHLRDKMSVLHTIYLIT